MDRIGRTWADVFSNGVLIFSALGFLLIAGWFGWFSFLAVIPLWVFYSIGMSVIFIPFLVKRAKDDAHLVVVIDGDMKLTEYRIGKRYDWDIDGEPLNFTSNSGTRRMVITDLDVETGQAKGSALAGYTQFDLARDMGVFTRLSRAFSEHLAEERVTKEAIAVEVERRVNSIAQRYIGLLYGTLEPTELEAALDVKKESKNAPLNMDISEVLNDG